MALNPADQAMVTEKLGITDALLEEATERVNEYIDGANITKTINSLVAGIGIELLQIYEANKVPALGTFIVEELTLNALRELVALGIATDADETPAA
jgi:hypothetical protein